MTTTKMLGKKRAVYDPRTLRLSQYLDVPKLPPLPTELNLYKKVSKFNIDGNDQYGNCVAVGMAHAIQTWSASAAKERIIPAKDVVATYLKQTGGQDSGLVVLDFLNYWRHNGLWDHPLAAFVSFNPRSARQLQYAVYLFGGVIMGLSLPEYIADATTWDLPGKNTKGDTEPGSWGGHCVHLGAYSAGGHTLISTWDEEMPTSQGFINAYADESYTLLSLDWFTAEHKSVTGFAYKDLMADLAKITA